MGPIFITTYIYHTYDNIFSLIFNRSRENIVLLSCSLTEILIKTY